MRRLALTSVLTFSLALAGGAVAPAAGAAPAPAAAVQSAAEVFPKIIYLPDGFRPEGIATGRGVSFYVGSVGNGAIYRGSLVTGEGAVLVPGQTGNAAAGIEVDRRNRLFVSGASTGQGRVYDADSGALLESYQFGTPGASFVNDVVVTRDAAYFTDSVNPVLYVVPIGRGGALGEFETLPLTGELVYATGFNVNGIEASADGRTLVVVQSNKGLLFAVDPETGVTTQTDLGGASVSNGDGLLRRGNTLYVVRNRLNQIDAFRVNRSFTEGTLINSITDPNFDVPTTVAAFGRNLYAVNARFGNPSPDTATYTIVQVAAR